MPLEEFVTLKRGFDLPARKRVPGHVPVLSSGETQGFHNEARVTGPGFAVGRATNLGRPTWSEVDFWPLNTVLYAKDFHGNVPKFAYYWFLGSDLSGYNSGSVQPMLNRNYIAKVPVQLPPVDEQRAIAATLGALDDKIESNRRLADLAGALINARAQRMLDVEQVHSRQLGEVVEFNAMSTRPGEPDQEIIYIDIASVSPGEIGEAPCLPWAEAPSRARRKVVDGDVIYSTVRPGRRSFSQVLDPDPRTVVSTGFAVMTPGPEIGSSLLTTVAGSTEFAEYLASVAHGSAYPAVSVRAMGQYNLLLPDLCVVRTFETDTMPLRRRVAHAKRESAALASLRDALLPALLSGRIKVSEARETIEETIDEEVPHA